MKHRTLLLRKSILIPIVILFFIFLLHFFADQIKITKKIELDTLDLRFALRGPQPTSGQVVIIAIDEKSIAKIGRWPWPRNTIAAMIDLLGRARPRAVGLDIIFSEPYALCARKTIENIAETAARHKASLPPAVTKELKSLLEQLDSDVVLGSSLTQAGDVTGAVYFTLPGHKGKEYCSPEQDLVQLRKSRYPLIANKDKEDIFPVINAREATVNITPLSRFMSSEGFVNYYPDFDGVMRRQPGVIRFRNDYYPSLALQLARFYLKIPLTRVKLVLGEEILLNRFKIPLSHKNDILINYYGPNETFPYFSFFDVLAGHIDPSLFTDKIVILGGTDPGLWDNINTPFSPNFPGVETHANLIENIINQDFLIDNLLTKSIGIIAVIVLVILASIFLPRFSPPGASLFFLLVAGAYLCLVQVLFVRYNMVINVVYPLSAFVMNYGAITVDSLMRERREKKKIKNIFESCVDKSIVRQILDHPEKLKLGGERKIVTVLFSDIADFTGTSEKLPPEITAKILDDYFSLMAQVVLKNKGTIDKYIGDGLMALFGAPVFYPNHALSACRAALEMVAEIDKLQEEWRANTGRNLSIRIGINTGEMVVGYIGSRDIMSYTAIGKEVNLAQRLEDINRKYDTSIIISSNTFDQVKDRVITAPLGKTRVKGIEQELSIYQLKGINETQKLSTSAGTVLGL